MPYVDKGAELEWVGDTVDSGFLDLLQPAEAVELTKRTKAKSARDKSSKIENFIEDDERGFSPSLLLSATPDAQGEISLLTRASVFWPEGRFEMVLMDRPYLLVSSRLVERGQDYDMVKFKLVDQAF